MPSGQYSTGFRCTEDRLGDPNLVGPDQRCSTSSLLRLVPYEKPNQNVTSVLSQKFADKVLLVRAAFSQPRQGRKIVAQGARNCEKIGLAICSGAL